MYQQDLVLTGWLVEFNGKSAFEGYLTPDLLLHK